MASVYLPVPKVTQVTTPGIVNREEIEFSSSETVTVNNAGVGAGILYLLVTIETVVKVKFN